MIRSIIGSAIAKFQNERGNLHCIFTSDRCCDHYKFQGNSSLAVLTFPKYFLLCQSKLHDIKGSCYFYALSKMKCPLLKVLNAFSLSVVDSTTNVN